MAKKTTKKAGGRRPTVVSGPPEERAMLEVPAPRPLGSIIGQDRAVARLEDAMASGRLHHAWIFHGPEGVGKFTTALAWAALLLDPTTARDASGRFASDPGSPTQTLLASGTHPDLHVIVKELARFSSDASVRGSKLTTIAKDVVDEHLIRPASLAPVMRTGSMAGKVFIVDEAELMDRHAGNATTQNAILKTLEEPAPGTVIVLVTSSEDRLLPTIRSRCQRIAFTPLSEPDMRAWLGSAGPEVGGEERAWLLNAADGSPGRLISLHESGAYGWYRTIEPMLAEAERGVHPVGLGAAMAGLVDQWAAAWVKEGDAKGENRSKDAANRLGARRMLSLIGDRARAALSDPARAPAALHAIEVIGRAQRELDANVNQRLAFDHLAAGLSERPVGLTR